jgi:hypothetical protein
MRRESDRCADSTHFLQMVGRLRLPQGDGSALWRFMAHHGTMELTPVPCRPLPLWVVSSSALTQAMPDPWRFLVLADSRHFILALHRITVVCVCCFFSTEVPKMIDVLMMLLIK